MKQAVRVAVTGAAGQIGYSLLFRIASGEMLGKDQPVILQLLEVPFEKPQAALKGVMMELQDCAFPLLEGMIGTDDPDVAFKDADYCLLVGSRPRGPGRNVLNCYKKMLKSLPFKVNQLTTTQAVTLKFWLSVTLQTPMLTSQ